VHLTAPPTAVLSSCFLAIVRTWARALVFRAFEAFLEPDRDVRCEVAEFTLSGFQHYPRLLCPSAVVIRTNSVELPDALGSFLKLASLMSRIRPGVACVAASIRSIRDALDVRLGSLDGKESHSEREIVALGCRGVRAQIELRGSVIEIERIHPALSDGKGGST